MLSRAAADEAGRSLSADLCRLQPHFEEKRGKVQIRQVTDFHCNHRPSHAEQQKTCIQPYVTAGLRAIKHVP